MNHQCKLEYSQGDHSGIDTAQENLHKTDALKQIINNVKNQRDYN